MYVFGSIMSTSVSAAPSLITVFINGKSYEVEPGYSIIQVCEMFGIEIPRFCYHEKLQIAGNCRMCLVSVKGSPKPVASCAMPIADKMEIHTDTQQVKQMREGVMRFLLANHPLDCPICDQGGECDLQDQAMHYGVGHSDFSESKRAVSQKYFGRLVATNMTRCIHCTRCVRFMSDVAGTHELGMVNRGGSQEIVCLSESGFLSEISGNIIDLCPVGALTSRQNAFKSRPWELRHVETIDVMDALGCAIRIDCRGNEIFRILPRLNEDINEIWISDKTRFAYDGLSAQRIDRPYARKNNKLEEVTWPEAINIIASNIARIKSSGSGNSAAAIIGDMVDCESMIVLNDIMSYLDSPNIDCRQDKAFIPGDERSGYLFNSTIAGIDKADFILLLGVNPRIDAPILNARIRKRYIAGNLTVANLGASNNLTYPVTELGVSPDTLTEILSGTHEICQEIKRSVRPMMILGMDLFTRSDAEGIMYYVSQIADQLGFIQEGWNGFNVLHRAAARVGGLELGLVPRPGGMNVAQMLQHSESIDFLYLLGADEIDMSRVSSKFVIYQGHHGDNGAHRADVVLPGSTYTEKDCSYINTEGRLQECTRAVQPPGLAKEDWRILCDIACAASIGLPYNTLEGVRDRLLQSLPGSRYGEINPALWKPYCKPSTLSSIPISAQKINFYMTDSISRMSRTMVSCSTDATKRKIHV